MLATLIVAGMRLDSRCADCDPVARNRTDGMTQLALRDMDRSSLFGRYWGQSGNARHIWDRREW